MCRICGVDCSVGGFYGAAGGGLDRCEAHAAVRVAAAHLPLYQLIEEAVRRGLASDSEDLTLAIMDEICDVVDI